MQIDNELAKIQRQQELQRQLAQVGGKTQIKDNNFASLLDTIAPLIPDTEAKDTNVKDLAKNLLSPQETDYKNLSVMNLATVNAMLSGQLDGSKGEDGMQEFEDEILNIATMLDGLEAYGEKLSTQNSNKDAWAQLQSLMQMIPGLKEKNLPAGLSSILSEVEVLTKSEEFKMNRGDYEILG